MPQWDADPWDRDAQGDEGADARGWDLTSAWVPGRIEAPTAFALFPKALAMAPRALAERHFRVERCTVRPRGGHFAALEQPALLAEDLVCFLKDRSRPTASRSMENGCQRSCDGIGCRKVVAVQRLAVCRAAKSEVAVARRGQISVLVAQSRSRPQMNASHW